MAKNIVLLSDGTGNGAAKLSKTNVWRLYQALDLTDPNRQIAFYDDGVGSTSFKPWAILAGIVGAGLKRNVLDLYRFLCRHYEVGDRIYCFGFSRGAFTAGVVTAFIAHEGVVWYPQGTDSERKLRSLAAWAFRSYRSKRYHALFGTDRIGRAIRNLILYKGYRQYKKHTGETPNDKPRVAFLGLWDTVAAYGLPIDEMSRALNWIWPLNPNDHQPPDNVVRICQALALEEERDTFQPRMLDEASESHVDNIRKERLTQVWFAGVHKDVGGGYPDDSLSLIPLKWMAEEASFHGLILKDDWLRTQLNPSEVGMIHDSRKGLSGFYRYRPRGIRELSNQTRWRLSRFGREPEVTITRPKVHHSVLERIHADKAYSPLGFPERYAVVGANGDITESVRPIPGKAMEATWNLVWWKRVVYFSSLGSVAAFLYLIFKTQPGPWEERLTWLARLVSGTAKVLPDVLQPFVDAVARHPGCFAGFLAVFVPLLMIGDKLQKAIRDECRYLWRNGSADVMHGAFRRTMNAVASIRTVPLYRSFWLALREGILPAAVLALGIWGMYSGASRAFAWLRGGN